MKRLCEEAQTVEDRREVNPSSRAGRKQKEEKAHQR
jgi:hypothetical protein